MNVSTERLDRHFAMNLECQPDTLRSGGITIVEGAQLQFKFAKGYPLPLFGLAYPEGCVYRVQYGIQKRLEELRNLSQSLDDKTCDLVEAALENEVGNVEWFRGVRMWIDEQHFADKEAGEIREISETDERARAISKMWGGPVFAQIVDGKPVARAAIKKVSEDVWDISIETDDGWRGRGFAKSATSAAVKYTLGLGKLATWATDRNNAASIATAQSVGFQNYALEHGCFLRTASVSQP